MLNVFNIHEETLIGDGRGNMVKEEALTHGQKKAKQRKLNRKLFETFFLWLQNFIGDALGAAQGGQLACAGSGTNNNISPNLAEWKNNQMQMFSRSRTKARDMWTKRKKR